MVKVFSLSNLLLTYQLDDSCVSIVVSNWEYIIYTYIDTLFQVWLIPQTQPIHGLQGFYVVWFKLSLAVESS